MADGDSFVLVKSKKKSRIRTRSRRHEGVFSQKYETTDDNEIDFNRIKTKIQSLTEKLMQSEFYNRCQGALLKSCFEIWVGKNIQQRKVEEGSEQLADSIAILSIHESQLPCMELVCYGIGSIASSLTAQYQLALCRALRLDFKIDDDHFLVYDPIFSNGEKQLLKDLHFTVIDKNEEGKHPCQIPTIFFMPHCGKALYNNLLWSNWSPSNLHNMVVIGNSFSAMVERTPERLLKKTGSYILEIQKYTSEVPLQTEFDPPDVFNDLSIHYFPEDKLCTIPQHVWTSTEPPIYDSDPEIIRNT